MALCTLAGSLLSLAFRHVCVPSTVLFFRWRVCRLKEFVCFAWARLGAIFSFFWRSRRLPSSSRRRLPSSSPWSPARAPSPPRGRLPSSSSWSPAPTPTSSPPRMHPCSPACGEGEGVQRRAACVERMGDGANNSCGWEANHCRASSAALLTHAAREPKREG